ncbi:unnamed protein product [Menidia menidia]|uniref:Thymidine kinase n=1 Tax=Menidia menidia TaxID=238744 RepID=A0A8S4BA32_9TELE|nr:unnamed protein product [Menidia menidia]
MWSRVASRKKTSTEAAKQPPQAAMQKAPGGPLEPEPCVATAITAQPRASWHSRAAPSGEQRAARFSELMPFGNILHLIPLAESVVKLNAVCMQCYKEAAYTKRLGAEKEVRRQRWEYSERSKGTKHIQRLVNQVQNS